jgi:hypothetical protein
LAATLTGRDGLSSVWMASWKSRIDWAAALAVTMERKMKTHGTATRRALLLLLLTTTPSFAGHKKKNVEPDAAYTYPSQGKFEEYHFDYPNGGSATVDGQTYDWFCSESGSRCTDDPSPNRWITLSDGSTLQIGGRMLLLINRDDLQINQDGTVMFRYSTVYRITTVDTPSPLPYSYDSGMDGICIPTKTLQMRGRGFDEEYVHEICGWVTHVKATQPSLDRQTTPEEEFLRAEDKNWIATPHSLTKFSVKSESVQQGGHLCVMTLSTSARTFLVHRMGSILTGSDPCVTFKSGAEVSGVLVGSIMQFPHRCCAYEGHPNGKVVVDEWSVDSSSASK